MQEIRIPASDGILLAADVYLPESRAPLPTLLARTPYGKRHGETWLYAHPSWYARRGYAVVVQDVRGRGHSGGEFYPFHNEAADGAGTINWIAAQDWCDGQVGTYGMSYPGATQLLAAGAAPSALRAIAPGMTGSTYCEGWTYTGGVFNLAAMLSWAVDLGIEGARRAGDLAALAELTELALSPQRIYERYDTVPLDHLVSSATWRHIAFVGDWLNHRNYDAYWRSNSPAEVRERIQVPALHIAGWYDTFLAGTLENYLGLTAHEHAPQHLVIGPWHHIPWGPQVGERWFGAEAVNRINDIQIAWFDLCLGRGGEELPPVQAFVMGRDRWTNEESWPPSATRDLPLYLSSDGWANSLSGNGRLVPDIAADDPPDICVHDPRTPVISLGGHSCCFEHVAPMGVRDQRSQELRNDVLIYDSGTLETPLLIAGEVRALLFVATSGSSADVVVRLVDAQSDGAAQNLADSVVRIGKDLAQAELAARHLTLLSGGVFRIDVSVGHTYVLIPAGHSLRLEVASSSFPAYERNWNGFPPHEAPTSFTEAITTQTLFHDSRYPSGLIVPVLER